MVAFALIGLGFLTVIFGALLMCSHDRAGRTACVAGATMIMAGVLWQAVAGLF
jgi:hypothetical protein